MSTSEVHTEGDQDSSNGSEQGNTQESSNQGSPETPEQQPGLPISDPYGTSGKLEMKVIPTVPTEWTMRPGKAATLTTRDIDGCLEQITSLNDLPRVRDHVESMEGLEVEKVGQGCLSVVLDCSNLDSLESLWQDYESGKLNWLFEKDIITEDILERSSATRIPLQTTIERWQYELCKLILTTDLEDVPQPKEKSCGICGENKELITINKEGTCASGLSTESRQSTPDLPHKIIAKEEGQHTKDKIVDEKQSEENESAVVRSKETDLAIISIDPDMFDKRRVEKVISKIHNEAVKARQNYKVKAKGVDQVAKEIRNVAVLKTKSGGLLRKLMSAKAGMLSLLGIKKLLVLDRNQHHCISGKVIHRHIIDDLNSDGIDIDTKYADTNSGNLRGVPLLTDAVSEKEYLRMIRNLTIENGELKKEKESSEVVMKVSVGQKDFELETRKILLKDAQKKVETLSRQLAQSKVQSTQEDEFLSLKVKELQNLVDQKQQMIDEIQKDMTKCQQLLSDLFDMVDSYTRDDPSKEQLIHKVKMFLLGEDEKAEDSSSSPEKKEIWKPEKVPKSWTDLHIAALNGDTESALKLIETGTEDIDLVTAEGYTALHIAASNNNLNMVKCLVEAKAKLDMKDKMWDVFLQH
ncbi:uncharacterized protein LOC144433045 [Glandiceps talaboti]